MLPTIQYQDGKRFCFVLGKKKEGDNKKRKDIFSGCLTRENENES